MDYMMKNNINVCFITDESYAMPTGVAIQSLIENASKKSRYNIYIVAVNLDEKSIKNLKKLQTNKCRIIIKQTENIYADINTKHPHVSKAALLKFNLPNILSNLDKVLYLDGDILVLNDLSELYNTDLNNKYAGVVKDMAGTVAEGHAKRLNHQDYFNSGMMLLNLEKMRQDNIAERLLDYKLYKDIKHFMDQDCLNYVFQENVIYVSPMYNWMASNQTEFTDEKIKDFYKLKQYDLDNIRKKTTVLHLTNRKKPWNSCDVIGSDIWHKYYKDYQFKIDKYGYVLKKIKNLFYEHKFYPNGRHKFYILGIRVLSYKPRFAPGAKVKGNFLYTKEKCPNGRRHIYVCGIKVFSYSKKNKISKTQELVITEKEPVVDMSVLWQMQRVARLHNETFASFKNINNGKDVVIVCTGPSLNDFKPIKDAVYIGVNRAFAAKNLTLDYLFMQDYTGLKDYIEDSFPYKNKKLIRFYGIEPYGKIDNFIIPESIAIRHNAKRYYCHASCSKTPDLPDIFAYDLCTEELYSKGSTVFDALQFALWTNPKRIYLVGCDCSNAGHFNAKDSTQNFDILVEPYRLLKEFASVYYPETEIISVNPVGLKGVFKDLYQRKED